MNKKHITRAIVFVVLTLLLYPSLTFGQRTGYSKEEFLRRRGALMEKASDGMMILFGETMPLPGAHFHQGNDFYYLTGVEDPGAVLILVPRT